MTPDIQLLPCPFCGGHASQPECLKAGGSTPRWEVHCAPMFCVSMTRRSRREVVQCWNQRFTVVPVVTTESIPTPVDIVRSIEFRAMRSQYLGVLRLLCDTAVHLPVDSDSRESIERALVDATRLITGLNWKRVLNSFEVWIA